jgi:hypothetical protein
VTIDQLSAEAGAAYLRYLRDRGAAPATLRKVKTLLASLAAFCAETPGYEAGLRGDAPAARLQGQGMTRLGEGVRSGSIR